VGEYGKSALRDGQKLAALLSDLAPQLTRERNILKTVSSMGLLEKLADAFGKAVGEQRTAINQCVSRLNSEYDISKECAEGALWPYAEALGFEARPKHGPKQEQKPQAPPRPKQEPKPKLQPPPKDSKHLAKEHFDKGAALSGRGDWDAAILEYTNAINIDPNCAEAYNGRGSAYIWKKDYDRAIVDYTQAIKICPNYTEAYNCRGVAYSWKNDYGRAIADYTQAITLWPYYAEAYKNRAKAYSAKGNKTLAGADYAMARQLSQVQWATSWSSRTVADAPSVNKGGGHGTVKTGN
jgi:tetratricopeptide (TPR) repeat protein